MSATVVATALATLTSLAPLARRALKATTGSPSTRANVRGSATVSVTTPRSSRRTVAPADLGAAAGNIDVGAAQAAADIDCGQADCLHAIGIERDEDFAIDAADALDPANAANALQAALHHLVDKVGQLLWRLARRYRRVGDDAETDHIDALNERLVDIARQV